MPDEADTVIVRDEDAAPPAEETNGQKGTVKGMAERFKQNMADMEKPPIEAAPVVEPPKPEPTKPEPKKPEPPKPKPEPVTKPTEPKTKEEPEVPAAIKSPKAAQEFRNLKMTMTSQLEAKAAELSRTQSELAKVKNELGQTEKGASPDEVAQLRQERDQLAGQLERVALEQSPAFQGRYSKKAEMVLAQAVTAAGDKYKDTITALISMPPSEARKKQLGAVLTELETPDQVALTVAVSGMDQLRAERDNELTNYRDTLRRQQEEALLEEQKKDELNKAQQSHILKEVLRLAPDEFDAFKRTGDSERDKMVDDYEADVRKALSGDMTPAESAFLPVMAAEGMHLKQVVIPGLQNRVKELETQLAEMSSTSPAPERTDEGRKFSASKTRSAFIDKFNEAQRE